MKWFKDKTKTITEETLKEALKEQPSWRINSTHDSMVDVEFDLVDFNENIVDDLNITGTVTYSLDTDYGGGPGHITVPYELVNGELAIDLDSVVWDEVLDFTIIDEQTDEDYGDGELDSSDDWDDDESAEDIPEIEEEIEDEPEIEIDTDEDFE